MCSLINTIVYIPTVPLESHPFSSFLTISTVFAVILHYLWFAASVKGLPVQQWIPNVLWECLRVRPAVNSEAVELWLAETLSLTPSLMVHRAHQPR